ncbi:MAG: NUDIX domain-containing protein [Desulfomonile tiedjei]|uniref:NUDIX domain-containing protein n=1 Tax=Desulfomonile tiedjei TaxID=2358 RepID=A0A9D6Z4T0_9BACT|nr:NUDIX domain-containing protein [Desulfomonile tiedjei]
MHDTDHEILEVVDSKDNVIGTATRAEIHHLGLQHRSVHVFVFNRSGEIYVQRRSESKDRHAAKLDSSAAGHVDPGETYEQSAIRELEEELGIREDVTEILRVAASPETDNEHVVLYLVTTELEPNPNPAEVQWGGFMRPEQLEVLIKETPGDFVPAFILLWNEFLRKTK